MEFKDALKYEVQRTSKQFAPATIDIALSDRPMDIGMMAQLHAALKRAEKMASEQLAVSERLLKGGRDAA